jgi:hypothetical protein
MSAECVVSCIEVFACVRCLQGQLGIHDNSFRLLQGSFQGETRSVGVFVGNLLCGQLANHCTVKAFI